jgi:hypothetical protein
VVFHRDPRRRHGVRTARAPGGRQGLETRGPVARRPAGAAMGMAIPGSHPQHAMLFFLFVLGWIATVAVRTPELVQLRLRFRRTSRSSPSESGLPTSSRGSTRSKTATASRSSTSSLYGSLGASRPMPRVLLLGKVYFPAPPSRRSSRPSRTRGGRAGGRRRGPALERDGRPSRRSEGRRSRSPSSIPSPGSSRRSRSSTSARPPDACSSRDSPSPHLAARRPDASSAANPGKSLHAMGAVTPFRRRPADRKAAVPALERRRRRNALGFGLATGAAGLALRSSLRPP